MTQKILQAFKFYRTLPQADVTKIKKMMEEKKSVFRAQILSPCDTSL